MVFQCDCVPTGVAWSHIFIVFFSAPEMFRPVMLIWACAAYGSADYQIQVDIPGATGELKSSLAALF